MNLRRLALLAFPLRRGYDLAWVSLLVGMIVSPGYVAVSDSNPSLVTLEERAVKNAVEVVADSVVQVSTIGGHEKLGRHVVASGPTTGLIISSDGFILSSAFNFAAEPSSIFVRLPSGKQVAADLVATDYSRMLVLLKTRGAADLPVPNWSENTEVEVGAWAIAVGRAFRADRPNVTVGIVGARNRLFGKVLQTDAAVSPANYGGPLIDIYGRVLGVLVPMSPQSTSQVAGLQWYDSGVGFAVPLAPITERIERMKLGEDQQPGRLGVGLTKANPFEDPVTVATVRAGSPAAGAGLLPGDRIVEVDHQPAATFTSLRYALGHRYAGETVVITVLRGENEQRVEAEVMLAGPPGAYRHAFLGVLPVRPAEAGVVVRATHKDSPAEKAGLLPGDHILKVNGAEIKTIDAAIEAMNGIPVGAEVVCEFEREAATRTLTVTAAGLPTDVPTTLPPATTSADPDAVVDSSKKFGRDQLKLPQFPNDCTLYVPKAHQHGIQPGLLLWLHAPGDYDAEARIDAWGPLCEQYNLVFAGPAAEKDDRWQRSEVEYLGKLLVSLIQKYHVDPRRVVVHGRQGGGQMACLLGLAGRNVVRGISLAAAPVPRQIQVPHAEPSVRLAIFAGVPVEQSLAMQMREGLRELSSAGYPVTVVGIGAESGQLTANEREPLARWIDSLDHF
jgi:serine protease Do